MTVTTKQSRPGGNGTALEVASTATHSLDDLDQIAERAGGAFAVVVELAASVRPAALPEPLPVKYRRRVFMSIGAAENAARRAAERGLNARVVLVELRPVARVVGGAR